MTYFDIVTDDPNGGKRPIELIWALLQSPAVLTPHTNVVVSQGSQLALHANTIQGTNPATYQWLYFDRPIVHATQAILHLTNLPVTGEGIYSVIVSNQYDAAIGRLKQHIRVPPNWIPIHDLGRVP